MSIDISEDPLTLALKDKWTQRGVPVELFNALVAEANAEYNAGIGYDDYNRFAMLTINLIDTDTTENCYYLYDVSNYGLTLFGIDDTTITHIFGQVPCVHLDIQVFKVTQDNLSVISYSYATLNHSQDETINVTLANISGSGTTKTTLTQVLLNPSFEDDLAHWSTDGSGTISTAQAHSGSKSMRLSNGYVQTEDLTSLNINTNDVNKLSFWALTVLLDNGGFFDTLIQVSVFYTDSTIDNIITQGTFNNAWNEICVSGLTPNKTINFILFRSGLSYMPIYIDDVSLIVLS